MECALKSLLLRYLNATMASQRAGGRPSPYPWTLDASGKAKKYGHLPDIWSDVAILARGRSGSTLVGVLTASTPFATWDVADRYMAVHRSP